MSRLRQQQRPHYQDHRLLGRGCQPLGRRGLWHRGQHPGHHHPEPAGAQEQFQPAPDRPRSVRHPVHHREPPGHDAEELWAGKQHPAVAVPVRVVPGADDRDDGLGVYDCGHSVREVRQTLIEHIYSFIAFH